MANPRYPQPQQSKQDDSLEQMAKLQSMSSGMDPMAMLHLFAMIQNQQQEGQLHTREQAFREQQGMQLLPHQIAEIDANTAASGGHLAQLRDALLSQQLEREHSTSMFPEQLAAEKAKTGALNATTQAEGDRSRQLNDQTLSQAQTRGQEAQMFPLHLAHGNAQLGIDESSRKAQDASTLEHLAGIGFNAQDHQLKRDEFTRGTPLVGSQIHAMDAEAALRNQMTQESQNKMQIEKDMHQNYLDTVARNAQGKNAIHPGDSTAQLGAALGLPSLVELGHQMKTNPDYQPHQQSPGIGDSIQTMLMKMLNPTSNLHPLFGPINATERGAASGANSFLSSMAGILPGYANLPGGQQYHSNN